MLLLERDEHFVPRQYFKSLTLNIRYQININFSNRIVFSFFVLFHVSKTSNYQNKNQSQDICAIPDPRHSITVRTIIHQFIHTILLQQWEVRTITVIWRIR